MEMRSMHVFDSLSVQVLLAKELQMLWVWLLLRSIWLPDSTNHTLILSTITRNPSVLSLSTLENK